MTESHSDAEDEALLTAWETGPGAKPTRDDVERWKKLDWPKRSRAVVTIALTKNELDVLDAAAQYYGQQLGEYIKTQALRVSGVVTEIPDDD